MDNFDIFNAIYQTDQQLHPLMFCYEHILGHQYQHCPFHQLSLEAKLNIECDKWAAMLLPSFSISVSWYTLVFPLQVHHYSFMAIWLFEIINWSLDTLFALLTIIITCAKNTIGELVIVQRSTDQPFPLPSESSKPLIKLVSKSSCTAGFLWMH